MTPAADRKGEVAEKIGHLSPLAEEPGRALIVWSSGMQVATRLPGFEQLALDEEACDLSSLSTGRAPLLLDHARCAEAVVGVVEHAWLEDGLGWAIARFGNSTRAREVRQDVEAGVLVNCSIGYCISECEEGEGSTPECPIYRVTRFRPFEISIVALGADAIASVKPKNSGPGLQRLLERKRAESAEKAAARRLAPLKPERWRAWAENTADHLAVEFGVPAERIATALRARVDDHLAALAAP